MPRIDNEDICVWPCGTYCTFEELEEFMSPPCAMSDDYEIFAYDSRSALLITGYTPDTEWVLGPDPDDTLDYEPCGYCGSSQNPNDICATCFDNLGAK